MRRAALAAAALLAGCGAGAPEEEGAERAVAQRAGAESAECTSRSHRWFVDGPPAKVLLCTVRVGDGFCDRYRVDRDGARYRTHLLERRGSCTLPAG